MPRLEKTPMPWDTAHETRVDKINNALEKIHQAIRELSSLGIWGKQLSGMISEAIKDVPRNVSGKGEV